MAKRLYLIAVVIVTICGCGVVSPLRNGTTTPTGSSGGKLYVSTAGSILRFGSALSANGNVAPEVTISGVSSQLNGPKRIFLDVNSDRLFVANSGSSSILIFSPASSATAGSTPSAVLTSTGNMVTPFDLAIDAGANLLYVADSSNNSILVFANESGLSGNVNTAPVRTMTVSFNLTGIFVDPAHNNLFIADAPDNSVDILQNASTATGAITLLLSPVTGAATNLSSPSDATLDSGGRLVVSNNGTSPSVLIFTNLVVPSGGNTSPAATIAGGSSNVAVPGQMVFNGAANNGELYVADAHAPGILVFTNINSANGTINSAPARSLVGSGTQLNTGAVNGVALDTTR
ncbi:MAG TPA: hypothetical protein VKW06_16465 [Candidatus Angelobacter sp.]|nr:hypothetical protein [Candidatus Angelobacter sp.]